MSDSTMRQRWELVRDEHDETSFGGCLAGCHGSWPCVTRLEAEAALRELGEMEAAMNVLYEYAGIGTERPPEHVFAALRRLHGVPDPVAAATPPETFRTVDWRGFPSPPSGT